MTKTIYRTADGKIFQSLDQAVNHENCRLMRKYGETGHYELIEYSDDNGQTWY